MLRLLPIIVLSLVLIACGRGIDQKGKKSQESAENNAAANNGAENNASENNAAPASCGDGVLDAGELCDPAKSSGGGACPQSCEAPACATATLVGSAEQCTAQCIVQPVACASGDGCCPEGCDSATDGDCGNACGDGVTEAPESCDGNCPTACDDANACTTDALVGSAGACSARCTFEPVVACASGDGCCPSGCTSDRDADCEPTVTCGNGMLDPGELCDGNCPTSCNDNNACTNDVVTGSATTCNAQCAHSPKTACVNGDGCCPSGCTFQSDNDCSCTPRTCAQVGAECGSISNGCGGTVTCADTCTSIEACNSENKCVEEDFIGMDCTDYPQCGSSEDAVCILPPDWPGGYCSILCNSQSGNTLCPSGSHCADFDGANSLCLLNCTSSTQCEAGYVCRQWDGVGGMECVPPAPVPGTGEVGDACASDADCAGDMYCETSITDSNNITTAFPGGVCTRACFPLLDQCMDIGGVCNLDSLCMQPCTTSAECRVGYTCTTGVGLPVILTYCWPD